MNGGDHPCVAQTSRAAAGVSDSVGGKAPFNKPIIIGVTGGIASGKSTLARMIAGRGILHLDADKIVHELMLHDREMIADIASAFPSAVRQNKINRAALAEHISKHPKALGVLEAIIHPHVRGVEVATIEAARRNRLSAVVLDVPLLFETDAHTLCDIVVVAHAPLSHRRARAFARPGMTEEKWQRLLARQLVNHHRHPHADVIIATNIGKVAMRREVDRLMNRWGLK
jgi:dephospho-CoA kinase